MRARRTIARLILLVLVIGAAVSSVHAQQLSANGRLLVQNGRVSVEHGGDLWAISPGQTITPGQVLVTGPDGYAQVELSDHSVIEVFPNSRLVFRPNRTNWRDLIDIFLGKIRLQIQHLTDGESPYRVTSPTAVISIRGTVLDVEVGARDETTIQVETGVVGVRHRLLPGKEVTVETGQTLRVIANVPLAALKGTPRLVVAGRVARIAGETLARIGVGGGKSSSSGGGMPSGGGTAPPGAAAGTNEPAPPPGHDGGGGGAGSSGSSGGGPATGGPSGGAGAPPGDVIRP